jgi:type IV pilus assembly protein PilP
MMAKKRNNINYLLIMVTLFLLVLAGCKKKQEPASVSTTQPVAAVQASKSVQKPLSTAKKPVAIQGQESTSKKVSAKLTLDFANRKDPFRPAIFAVTPVSKGGSKDVNLDPNLIPIQRFEVEKFKITGIIAGLKENRALLVDPDGKAYVARTGMVIGPNSGKITRITTSTVEVEESFKDDAGRIKKRTIKLALQRKR